MWAKLQLKVSTFSLLASGLLLGNFEPSFAQTADEMLLQAEIVQALEKRNEQIGELVREQEAVIRDLRHRIEELERRSLAPQTTVSGLPADASPPVSQPPSSAPVQPEPKEQLASEHADEATPPVSDPAEDRAPGAFEVDEDAAERALERTLVQTGALLIPFGHMEIEPVLTFVRQEEDQLLQLFVDGQAIAVTQQVEQNLFTSSLGMRAGLPLDSQLEFRLPFEYKELSAKRRNPIEGPVENSQNAFGLGDISVGLSKALLYERGWWPDLTGRLVWNTTTGQEKNGILLGDGFNTLTTSLTALKRQDPLAFVGSFFYTSSFEKQNIDQGDSFGLSLGTVLAASPDTSLSFFLSQSFSKEDKNGGQRIAGSDDTSAVLSIGASSVLGRGVLLSLSGGIGLTNDAPDYFVTLSLPIRLNLPSR